MNSRSSRAGPSSAPAVVVGAVPARRPAPLTLLSLPTPSAPANALIIVGLPWYVRDVEYRDDIRRKCGLMRCLRCYDDQLNGSSRGILLVQFADPDVHATARSSLQYLCSHPVSVHEVWLSDQWDSTTAPPPLPFDPLREAAPRGGNRIHGYGPQLTQLRAVGYGDANTLSVEGWAEYEQVLKKWRTEHHDDGSGSHNAPANGG